MERGDDHDDALGELDGKAARVARLDQSDEQVSKQCRMGHNISEVGNNMEVATARVSRIVRSVWMMVQACFSKARQVVTVVSNDLFFECLHLKIEVQNCSFTVTAINNSAVSAKTKQIVTQDGFTKARYLSKTVSSYDACIFIPIDSIRH